MAGEHDRPRSWEVTEGAHRAPARAMLRAVGLGDDDFGKAQVAVASSWNEVTPCNYHLDALAAIAGCDKSEPGMMMAIARLNLPSVYLYGGTILPGTYRGRDITIQDVFEAGGAPPRGAKNDQGVPGGARGGGAA